MYWQIIEKACFTEYQDCQCPSAEGTQVLRSIPVATYRYYLLRHGTNCIAVLEQEHWSGEFVSFYTPQMSMQEGRLVYNKMASCTKNPESIQNMGIEGTPYEGCLDLSESDFGLVVFSEEELGEEPVAQEEAPKTTGGYRPVDSPPAESWLPPFMRPRPEYTPAPQSTVAQPPIDLPGIPAPASAPAYAPMPTHDPYSQGDQDVDDLPELPPLPEPVARERNPLDLAAHNRRPTSVVVEEEYDEDEEDDYEDAY